MKKSLILVISGLFLFITFNSVFSPAYLIQPVYALNGFVDPNGDGSTGNWSSTGTSYYTEIDEAIRQPTAATITDYISATSNNTGTIYQNMGTVSGAVTTSDVTIWLYHNDGSNGQISVQLYNDDESTTYSSSSTVTQSSVDAWDSVTFSGLSLTQTQLDALTIAITGGKNGGGAPATITVYEIYADVTYSSSPPTYEQSAYRFFQNQRSTDVGTPLAAQDTAATLNAAGDAFRLRLLLHVGTTDLNQNGENFKLQFVDRGTGSCSSPSGGTPSTYTDVTSSTVIAYENNASVSDGDALTGNTNDPTHGTDTVNDQTYEEANNFTNSQSAINVGEDGMWDFALVDNNAPAATTYCFKVVLSDGTDIDTYTVYPQITTGNGTLSVDIVDASGNSVASPAFNMSSTSYLFTCDTTTTSIGTSAQRIEISNFTGTASWTTTIAATNGSTAVWSNGTDTYDFNDPSGTPGGCADGGDTDTVGGQLSLDPSVAVSTPRTGCSNTGITLGSSAAFDEGTTDAITLASASSSAETSCSWQLTGIDTSQNIPADQAAGNYSINLTITVTAI